MSESFLAAMKKRRADLVKRTYNAKYYAANKEHHAEKAKEYREANKEHVAERDKEYREANKERIAEKAKEWREANKERINARNREYSRLKRLQARQEKYEKLKQMERPPVTICWDCGGRFGGVITWQKHLKQITHRKWMEAQEPTAAEQEPEI